MLRGDILMVGCCIFYLLWWILAFKPTGAITGLKSGWLLIPAAVLGVAGASLLILGSLGAETVRSLFTPKAVLAAGVVSYVVLLLVTWFGFHRQVTTELVLIVGWTALYFLECNAMYGLEMLSRTGTIVLLVLAVIAAAVSMVCYVLYYGLDVRTGYVDGMIPLVLVLIFTVVAAVLKVRSGS